jgi:hypothetical protein
VRSPLIHAKREHESWNNDDSAAKAKHSRQQPSANTKPHQDEGSLL